MVSRISDPRLMDPDPPLAMMLDLLTACICARDVDFMFPELCHIAGHCWQVPVDAVRSLRFDLIDELGAFNIRLE